MNLTLPILTVGLYVQATTLTLLFLGSSGFEDQTFLSPPG